MKFPLCCKDYIDSNKMLKYKRVQQKESNILETAPRRHFSGFAYSNKSIINILQHTLIRCFNPHLAEGLQVRDQPWGRDWVEIHLGHPGGREQRIKEVWAQRWSTSNTKNKSKNPSRCFRWISRVTDFRIL